MPVLAFNLHLSSWSDMRIKVHNGTVSHGEQTLCSSCRHATITRGRTLDEEIVRCELRPMSTVIIRFKVTECSAYLDARLPSYAQLLEQAWILRQGKGRRPAGFVRSHELAEDELCEVMTDLREFEV